jgi:hypothetical protein
MILQQLPCGNFQWVPYDTSISPVENLYSNPDDLDPQPEYPLRTEMVFYKVEMEDTSPDLELLAGDLHPIARRHGLDEQAVGTSPSLESSNSHSFTFMFLLWILGLLGWFYFAVTMSKDAVGATRKLQKARNSNYKDK